VTGIATAYMDSIPMVIISGQVPTAAIGQDAFQECDTVGITRPCVKHNFLVKDVRDLAATVKKAFYIARTGRPGPVLIDIPKDVSKTPCQYEPLKTFRCARTTRSRKVTPARFARPWSLLAVGQASVHLHRRRHHSRGCIA
jgi:Thiamine pyrophosphate-requiring enzymes [acetolactate synthase, pyruvate dehydrogenase (cytochrome), glyoxylate carboligase, phosphonopyruvate decarboxylase]